MSVAENKIFINATIDIAPSTIQSIVENSKKIAGTDSKGIYRVDTAQKVNEMISSFLEKYNFDEYVQNPDNYKR